MVMSLSERAFGGSAKEEGRKITSTGVECLASSASPSSRRTELDSHETKTPAR